MIPAHPAAHDEKSMPSHMLTEKDYCAFLGKPIHRLVSPYELPCPTVYRRVDWQLMPPHQHPLSEKTRYPLHFVINAYGDARFIPAETIPGTCDPLEVQEKLEQYQASLNLSDAARVSIDVQYVPRGPSPTPQASELEPRLNIILGPQPPMPVNLNKMYGYRAHHYSKVKKIVIPERPALVNDAFDPYMGFTIPPKDKVVDARFIYHWLGAFPHVRQCYKDNPFMTGVPQNMKRVPVGQYLRAAWPEYLPHFPAHIPDQRVLRRHATVGISAGYGVADVYVTLRKPNYHRRVVKDMDKLPSMESYARAAIYLYTHKKPRTSELSIIMGKPTTARALKQVKMVKSMLPIIEREVMDAAALKREPVFDTQELIDEALRIPIQIHELYQKGFSHLTIAETLGVDPLETTWIIDGRRFPHAHPSYRDKVGYAKRKAELDALFFEVDE